MQLTARPAIPVIMDHTKHMFRQGKLDQSMSTKVGKGKEREKNRTIISGAKATTNDDGQLRDVRTRDSADHLGSVFGNAAFLCLRADHVPCNIYEEEQWDRTLRAELDEVGRLKRRRREENAVVRDNAHGKTVNVCETLPMSTRSREPLAYTHGEKRK